MPALSDAILTLLDAVTSGGSPDEAAAALGALVPEGERARILPAVESARRELDGLRRREHELSALFSSARELVGLRDTDGVMTRLVERAHEMLGADVTYLSEFDPATRELRVRTTLGAVSAEFRSLVVPPGRGLVSTIVETRMPHAVSRYDDIEAGHHAAPIDAAVAAEGIVSMLGVPLRTETTVLGVLFVAMRQERTFTPEQIALLSALADHASVVLQTADTMRDLRRSEEEAREALEQLTAHLAERDRANTVHQELVGAVLGGGGFPPVAETLAATLDRPVLIVDEEGEVRASARDTAPLLNAWMAGEVASAVQESRRSGHVVPLDHGDERVHVAALAAGDRLFGAIVAGAGAFELGSLDVRTLERAAQVGALLALSHEAATEAAHQQQGDLVADILTAGPERGRDVAARARRFGVDLAVVDSLVLLAVPGERRLDVARSLARVLAGALVGTVDGYVAVLTDPTRSGADAAALAREASAVVRGPVVAVAGEGVSLATRFDTARRTARLLSALGVEEAVVSSDAFLPYAAVFDGDQRALGVFLDTTIGAVRRHDAERGTELLATLRAFVRSGASPTKTARALTFHPNTILQRLERLDRVLGEGWRDDERYFRLSLAVRLDELRERFTDPV
ncbi:GAF domain-containing protein [Salinibacterium sp. SYSU T00001]|uniref:helix-turn-helix domain-containing protein n=1 Tax=Homoserinimonas sedimenticola TaxID=2986805 RepID=UPI002235BCA9|nr:GAF domain-containing protein [Salinibacterium sedimenticola]MCW4385368.1 GAF domain-containing protein [Salinibacterium sedimenticola]